MNPIKNTDAKPKVVVLKALGYSGATWVSLVLGSHPDALCVGPCDRIWKLKKEEADLACLIHYKECSFWPGFVRTWDRNKNFILELAEYSKKKLFILYVPTEEMTENVLRHPALDVRYLKVIRDGRAQIFSAMRHHAKRAWSCREAVLHWFLPAFLRLEKWNPPDDNPVLWLRYEDMVHQTGQEIARLGDFIGIRYPHHAVRYWEFEQHLVAGNTGTIDLLRKLQGLEGFRHHRSDFYNEAFKKTVADKDRPIIDESWREHLNREDLFLYDYYAGKIHEQYGYPRDIFSEQERSAYLEKYHLPAEFDAHSAKYQIKRLAPLQSFRRQSAGFYVKKYTTGLRQSLLDLFDRSKKWLRRPKVRRNKGVSA
ncbi:MAG: sulfotransferase domain-containing protein [Candidatus Omnitrophica bacterium]|nr:sulfotransferase domain-containing protein [Candidatus Omnitrophota bacterium]